LPYRKNRQHLNPSLRSRSRFRRAASIYNKNTVYGPGLQTMDLALVRSFSLAEKARFETRAEFFNALNHTNLGTPNRFVNTSSFGSITEVATPGREIQVSARLSF
jgi:hypothetical protein